MGILSGIGQLFWHKPEEYTAEEYGEFQDGFATGYPLVGQPERPSHDSAAYRRGLAGGQRMYRAHGCPQIQWEDTGEEEQ